MFIIKSRPQRTSRQMRIPRACIQSTEPVARRPAGSQLRDTLATRHRRKGEDLKQQGASGIYLDPENSFFHNKRKGKGRKRKAPTPGPAAHIRSPWRTGVLPLLWAEGRPGGPAPVAGSSRPPCIHHLEDRRPGQDVQPRPRSPRPPGHSPRGLTPGPALQWGRVTDGPGARRCASPEA